MIVRFNARISDSFVKVTLSGADAESFQEENAGVLIKLRFAPPRRALSDRRAVLEPGRLRAIGWTFRGRPYPTFGCDSVPFLMHEGAETEGNHP